MWKLKVSPNARKFIKKIKNKIFLKKLIDTFDKLIENPFHHAELDIKKLRGSQNDYRLRVGNYRFLYTIFKEEILIYIYKIDKRGDIY